MYNKTFFLMLCFILLSVSIQADLPESSPAGGNYLALDGKDDYAVLDFSKFGVLLTFRSFFDQYMRICINWYQKLTPNVHKLPMISPTEREHVSAIRTKV